VRKYSHHHTKTNSYGLFDPKDEGKRCKKTKETIQRVKKNETIKTINVALSTENPPHNT
jgi:hypothetical protein